MVPRPRLVSRLGDARLAIVEAGSGYGKSVLAAQLADHLGHATATVALDAGDSAPAAFVAAVRRALRAARLSDLVPALDAAEPKAAVDALLESLAETDEPILLVLDDAHHLADGPGAELALRLVRSLPLPHRALVAARWLPPSLSDLRRIPESAPLGTDDLRFTDDETERLLAARELALPLPAVRSLVEATDGWAAALAMAAAAFERAPDPLDALARLSEAAPSALVEEALGRLPSADRATVVQLAHLPLLSPEVAAAVGERADLFDRLAAAGLPLARASSGWWELPGPVVEHLRDRGTLGPEAAAAAAALYVSAGERTAALRTLLAGRNPAGAARLLESLEPEQVEALGCEEVAAFVSALGDEATADHPRVLLHLARAAEAAYRSDLRRGALDRAGELAEKGGIPEEVMRELDAERARDLLWDESTRPQAARLAETVLDRASNAERVARARALDVLGRARCWLTAEGPRERAEPLLAESIRLCREIGARTWAAQAVVPLAWGVHFALCRYDRALATLDEALADLPARSRYRPVLLSFRADVLTELGRPVEAEATVEEMRELGRLFREAWALAFASWAEARIASYAGDAERTLHAVLDVERHRDAWYERVAGLEFLAHAADLLDRAGEHALASEYLDRARSRADGFDRPVRLFSATVAGRSGPPDEAERLLTEMLGRPDLEPQERWHLELLRAFAAHRDGNARAAELAAAAFDTCLALGYPEGPGIREPAIADVLLPLAAAAGSASAADLAAGAGRLTLSLLGGFELRQGGRVLAAPAGKPALAIRAVAALGGRVHAEELAELLWPEAAPEAQRNRMRNLLSRARSSAGPLLVRSGSDVALPPGAAVDAAAFEADARAALALVSSGEPSRAAVVARAALGRYRGDLLPGDRYEPWAAVPREQLRMFHLELLDLVAGDAERRLEVDEAVRFLQRAIDVEPHDEARYVRLARLLASQGRVGSARATLRRAHAALAELGLEPSAALVEQERALGVDVV